MFYLTADMAREKGLPRPYTNLKTYLAYKSLGVDVLKAHEKEIQELSRRRNRGRRGNRIIMAAPLDSTYQMSRH